MQVKNMVENIILGIFLVFLGFIAGALFIYFKLKKEFERKRKESIAKSRAVLKGLINEQLSPYFPDFPFKAGELRFIGKPIDFIAFVGMDENSIKEVVFVEVKSGKAQLSNIEKSLREAIENGNIRWVEYRKKL